MTIRIHTHCGQWGCFAGQDPRPVFVGSIWECIAYRCEHGSAGHRPDNGRSTSAHQRLSDSSLVLR